MNEITGLEIYSSLLYISKTVGPPKDCHQDLKIKFV